MLAVAMVGQDPGIVRYVRVPGGWHAQGAAANHAHLTPPKPWARVGCCWDRVEHPVADVTAALA